MAEVFSGCEIERLLDTQILPYVYQMGEGGDWSGTAFCAESRVWTATHVAAVFGRTKYRQTKFADVSSYSVNVPGMKLANNILVNERVYVVSRTYDNASIVIGGIVLGRSGNGTVRAINDSSIFGGGMSGSPVINFSGDVLGVVTHALETTHVARFTPLVDFQY